MTVSLYSSTVDPALTSLEAASDEYISPNDIHLSNAVLTGITPNPEGEYSLEELFHDRSQGTFAGDAEGSSQRILDTPEDSTGVFASDSVSLPLLYLFEGVLRRVGGIYLANMYQCGDAGIVSYGENHILAEVDEDSVRLLLEHICDRVGISADVEGDVIETVLFSHWMEHQRLLQEGSGISDPEIQWASGVGKQSDNTAPVIFPAPEYIASAHECDTLDVPGVHIYSAVQQLSVDTEWELSREQAVSVYVGTSLLSAGVPYSEMMGQLSSVLDMEGSELATTHNRAVSVLSDHKSLFSDQEHTQILYFLSEAAYELFYDQLD